MESHSVRWLSVRPSVHAYVILDQKLLGANGSNLVNICTYGPDICTLNIFQIGPILRAKSPIL